jgi:type II secretory pathway predicted ATPase ExeA
MQNNNYLSFFGLRESPFNHNLDPRFLFLTSQLEKAFSEVMDRIHNGNCFAVITGEVGTGKTTLMHRLQRQLMKQGLPTAFLFYTHLNRTHLLDFIFADFGIPCNSGETVDDRKRLENWLVERHCGGKTPVLLVDEAQGLPTRTFQEIRMLLNLETRRERLLQVVLAGELELEEKLNGIQMRGLRQRITARCQTAALNRDEIFDYVQNRLQIGGAKGQPLFRPNAMDAIYFYSRGIHRVVNILCEQALDLPLIENQKQPTFTVEQMNFIVSHASGQGQVLYALLAGSGLRIGEAFGLEIKHLSTYCRTITIGQAAWGKTIQTPKTKSAYRQVDVSSDLAKLIKQFVGDRQSGLLFANRSGKLLSQTNVLRRSLRPILEGLGVGKTGFHSMRRFKATWLRKRRTPEELVRYWMGQAKQSVTDEYSKLSGDMEYRREVAEKIGTGFTVSAPMIPMLPRKQVHEPETVAA